MLHQKEILQWLAKFDLNQIKHIVTIKNPHNQHYIEQILNNHYKPNERILHGYTQQEVKGFKSIYVRQIFRYKQRKIRKKAIDEMLFENITVSRTNPYALSVKKSFILSGKLSECMMVLSDEQIFNCMTDKYSHSQLGSYQDSIWFRIASINSFSMWVIHFFELEIFEAFYTQKSIHAINPLSFAHDTLSQWKAKEMLQSIISNISQTNRKLNKQESGQQKLEVSKQQGAYLLTKCIQKLQEDRELCEIIFEDIWISCDRTSKVFKLLRELSEIIMEQYEEHKFNVRCQQIESFCTSKKKKKKAKRPKEETTQEQAKQQKQTIVINSPTEQAKIQQSESLVIIQPKQQTKRKEKKLKKQTIHSKQKNIPKEKQNKQYQLIQIRPIVRERINEYIVNYYSHLSQSSRNFDKHRKMCYQIINNTIEQLNLVGKWRLQLFGSASINFALKQSDLDLVLMFDNERHCSLKDIYQLFKVKEWLKNCNIIQARVPIVSFEVLLSQIKYPKNKKPINEVIHVDISISYSSSLHQGLKNTNFLKDIFDHYPTLMTICLILKEILRVNNLNKPYTGGISSYILVILTHNILKLKNGFEESLLDQINHIAHFMSQQFEPFVTLVTPFPNSKTKVNSQLSLNIEDPHQRVLLHTSARQIGQIIAIFKHLLQTLQEIQKELMQVKVQQKKKMKRIFFDHWNMLFQEETSQH